MAPLGIIMAITSAVRVGRPNWLKGVVGRAREGEAVAEVELMSSTSHEMRRIRRMGRVGRVEPKLFTLKTTIENKISRNDKERRKDHPPGAEEAAPLGVVRKKVVPLGTLIPLISLLKSPFARPVLASADAELAIPARERESRRRNHKEPPTPTTPPRHNTPTSAPNISLNFCKAKNLGELWLFAILGIILQFSSLIFIGVFRYHPKINPKEDKNSKYAYPLMASGTPIFSHRDDGMFARSAGLIRREYMGG
ncbi:unnamed protein product [Tuber aestivum]|uniref:Uncharacterized protein n=1 Tax=Tuber aestivum TaxID=59557 RepID=A0A292PZZ2_9PEZI|nr:unnamed protein product [Tuber aestivum]